MQMPLEHTRTHENRIAAHGGRREALARPAVEPGTGRPVLLAGEEEDIPDRHIFRGID
ncbi:hypothetical protein J7E96_08415 [Streptomyces sp. ISL-96]|uniref:hypothetical protein n=1 Tax=Streptomyces sp. ISL-96 TaxID=2819191 RepID=UPI001BE9153B|nr:hypothetical protein [Streptomyces sp. ISL-96]MBT2488545.1 hypothetical protein [Streptomyces sp. ISL-96]